jgi:hypothetical protein
MTENENVCNNHLKEEGPKEKEALSLEEQIDLFVEVIVDIYLQNQAYEE